MAVDGLAAAQTMINFGTWRAGYCLEAVWTAYKRNGASTGRSAPTAYVGWQNSDDKHPGDRNPPAGVPVWWGPKASSNAGDVVISLGGGRVVATDWPYGGVIGITTIDARERQIGRPYLGWTGDILGAKIAYGGGGDDMTPEEHNWLMNLYNGFFYGGPSLPDGNRPIVQTLADIAAGRRPFVTRTVDGKNVQIAWIQELADTKTLQIRTEGKVDVIDSNVDTLVARPPVSDEQIDALAADVSKALIEQGVGGATEEQVQAIVAAAFGGLVLVSQEAPART
ncbi:lysin A [Microbacterium phage Teamocil]|uniref:Lysin A n=1 Tax=Microbacterium phage Teamocil TaxID=2656554 RepID=A0A649VYA8_9CAUD|nr:lysin A [Microbacterium phage Teamocil]QGJ88898.1 lysin A [Microbacterium phage Gina]QGJ96995.1 lysin A [Microbacterium phage Teamocil]